MTIGFIIFSILIFLVLTDFFGSKPAEAPEDKLSKALADYLKAGVKVRQDDKS